MTGPLITAAELGSVLGETTVLDVRYRMGGPSGPEEFAAGHIPGAAYVDLDTALAAPPDERGRHPLPDPGVFEAAMRVAGVCNDRQVVVYDDWGSRAASRCWWLLRHHGHPSVRVLDGGWGAWQRAGLPHTNRQVAPEPGDFALSGASGANLPVVLQQDVLAFASSGVLIDARNPERFRGDVEPIDPVAGHIPGAVNVPTGANLADDGTFAPVALLREVYAAALGRDVAAYCGSGVTACHDILALATMGVDAALYPGSWSEWVADPGRPVATGQEPA